MKSKQRCDLCGEVIKKGLNADGSDDFHIMHTDEAELTIHKTCAMQLMYGAWDEQLLRSRYGVPLAQKGELLLSDPKYHHSLGSIELWSNLDGVGEHIMTAYELEALMSKAAPGPITKAYKQEDGSLSIEGWISTPFRDLQRDIMEPEAFAGDGLSGYFARGAPVSSAHDTTPYPVGYLQKAVLVRNGSIIQQEDNPNYPIANFRYFDPLGTGWYGLGTIDEQTAMQNISKGKVGSFSWIGQPVRGKWADLSDGGRHFSERGGINPLLEVTVTAYPVNAAAVMQTGKVR